MEGDADRLDPPESSVAQSFAADLDSMFGLNSSGSVATLSQTVEEKKANVTSGQSELEQLEAKLRETEQRLAKVSRQNSPSRQQQQQQQAESGATQKQTSPLTQNPTYPDDRPPTAKRPPSKRDDAAGTKGQDVVQGGQMNGRDDYVMVENKSGR